MKRAVLVIGLAAILLSTPSNAEDATTNSCTLLPAMISGSIPDLFSAVETCSKGRQGFAARYEISGTNHGTERRAFFDASGVLVGLDETMDLHSLPAFILDVLADRYAGQAILRVQKMRRATSVFYEITIQKDGKQQDIFFNAATMRGTDYPAGEDRSIAERTMGVGSTISTSAKEILPLDIPTPSEKVP